MSLSHQIASTLSLETSVIPLYSLQDMEGVCFPVVLMRRMMKRRMQYMILSTDEWMTEEKKEGVIDMYLIYIIIYVVV